MKVKSKIKNRRLRDKRKRQKFPVPMHLQTWTAEGGINKP